MAARSNSSADQTASSTGVTAAGSALVEPEAIGAALARAEKAAQAKRLYEAIGICRDVLEQKPDHAPALAFLGSVLGHRNEIAEAIRRLEEACALQPDVPAWHNNLSALYRMDWRLDEAVEQARIAVRLAPNAAPIRLSLGKALMDRGDRADAVACFLDVLTLDSQNAEAHLAIGQILLSHGEMRPGWLEYEWRNHLEAAKGTIPELKRPEWNGMAVPGGTILLIADQGYGDTVMFARYIPMVAERCEKVALACGADIQPLLGCIPGIVAAFSRWDEAPPFTVWCRLSSLAALFDTNLDTIPGPPPYIQADPDAADAMGRELDEKLAARSGGGKRRKRVGLFWSGRSIHPNDRRRSLRLAQLAPITSLPDIDFVSLQKEVPAADVALLAASPQILDLSPRLTDFSVTAAVLANLDLLVSIDSGVVHVAGAMGRPVWTLVGSPADWRWLHDREDSPWYPSMRLWRQRTPGAWAPLIETVAERLREMSEDGLAESAPTARRKQSLTPVVSANPERGRALARSR